jgi:hypothetical protein
MLFSEDPLIASTLLRQALRAMFTIEQDLDFTSRMELGVDLSTLEVLLDNGASPNGELPRSDKSVWYDFLLSLETNFPRRRRDPAWDMTPYIDPSQKPKAVWLPNWYQACEILISHGAKNIMHRVMLDPSVNVYAMDSIIGIFSPDQARALQQCYKKIEPSIASSILSRPEGAVGINRCILV